MRILYTENIDQISEKAKQGYINRLRQVMKAYKSDKDIEFLIGNHLVQKKKDKIVIFYKGVPHTLFNPEEKLILINSNNVTLLSVKQGIIAILNLLEKTIEGLNFRNAESVKEKLGDWKIFKHCSLPNNIYRFLTERFVVRGCFPVNFDKKKQIKCGWINVKQALTYCFNCVNKPKDVNDESFLEVEMPCIICEQNFNASKYDCGNFYVFKGDR